MRKSWKILITAVCTVMIFTGSIIGLYLKGIPALANNKKIYVLLQREIEKNFNTSLTIDNVKLSTGKNINLFVNQILLSKDGKILLNLEGLNTELSLSDILSKHLIVNKLLAENIYINTSELMALLPKEQEEKKQKSEFNFDIYSAILGVKKCLITYENDGTKIIFDSKNILLDRTKEKKYLHFDFDFELSKGKHKIIVSADDKNKIYMGNGELHVEQFPIEIDKSKIIIDAFGKRKHGIDLNIASKNFNAGDIYDIITSNIIIPNGKELLAPIENVKGNVDFNLYLTKNSIKGDIDVKEAVFEIKDLLSMPVKVTQGLIDIGNKNINFKDFKGYYNNKTENSFKMEGDIKDYWKTCDTKIVSDIFINDDFFKNYLTKMLGAEISLVGDAGSRLTLTSQNGSCDIVWYFLLREGEGFKLGEQLMVLEQYKTLFKVDLSVLKNILKINTIDYFITNELKKGMTPVLSINGNFDLDDNMKLLDINLNIPRPLPSEFLNFLCGQKLFKKGTISGELSINNQGAFPKMDGVISLDKVLVPSQRLFIKSAKIGAKGDKLGAISEGKFKRSNYKFNGYVVNDLRFPIIVKSINLNIDDLDIEKLLTNNTASVSNETLTEDSDDIPTFQKDLVIVEKCLLSLDKGKYKEVEFGNLQANLTLNKDGILEVQSNKFDIAEGISTLKVKVDLIKNLYYLRLGIKDVNSDIMASAILGLPREISGKARGLIELSSDSSLKLNGDIKFDIKNGTIEKVGYVEYILKAASLFRNPLAMISPATLSDLVNIPNGDFDIIQGEMKLKDNVITRMKIKSSAKQLSSFIIGKYNLETNDATLRIYTKMSNKGNGFAGVLRNLSLNSLANKISTNAKNDSNYYAAEIEQLPKIDAEDKDCQIFLTTVDGDVINFNFLSSLKRIK